EIANGPFGATSAIADASGHVVFQEPVVPSTAGSYNVSLTDTAIDGKVTLPVKMTGISMSLNPAASTSTNFLSGAGFGDGEKVVVSSNAPAYIPTFSVDSDTRGAFSSETFSISNAPAGSYTLTAVGQQTGWTATRELSITGSGLTISPS